MRLTYTWEDVSASREHRGSRHPVPPPKKELDAPPGERSGQRARKRLAGCGRAQPGHPLASALRRPHLLISNHSIWLAAFRQSASQASQTHGFRRAYGWHPCAVVMLLRNVAGGKLPHKPQCAVVAHPRPSRAGAHRSLARSTRTRGPCDQWDRFLPQVKRLCCCC